jgi:hypothetical protein
VQTETTFVWTEGGVELDSVSTVYLDLVLVIFPDDTELDDAFWDGSDLEGFLVFWVLFEEGRVLEGGGQLWWGISFWFLIFLKGFRSDGDCLELSPMLGMRRRIIP